MKPMILAAASQHKCISRSIIGVNCPTLASMLFKAIKMFIPENTARKVQIHSGNTSQMLQDLVAPN
jgi:hypothetical protein